MKARYALLSLALVLPACGGLHKREPLSGVGRDRGPLVLDGPGREDPAPDRDGAEESGTLARAMPWNWF